LLVRQTPFVPLAVVEEIPSRRALIRRGNAIHARRLLRARLTALRPELREEEEKEPDGGRNEPNNDARLFGKGHATAFARAVGRRRLGGPGLRLLGLSFRRGQNRASVGA
jgi:hypothetical protein